ncbi:MAG: hypothetical protein ACRCX2_01270 [Paraclostridium sp.]
MNSHKLSLEDFETALKYLDNGKNTAHITKNIEHLHKLYLRHTNCGMCPDGDMREVIDNAECYDGDLSGCYLSCDECWELCFKYWAKHNSKFWNL